ncbi:MAG: Bax inhibitor-1/YccA family protein [Bacilli bacterium]
MRKFVSKNPVFQKINSNAFERSTDTESTYAGVGLKILWYILMLALGAAALIGIIMYVSSANSSRTLIILLIIALVASFILSFFAMRYPKLAFSLGSLFCICMGMLLTVISFIFEAIIPGIIVSTIFAVVADVLVCGILYVTGLVRINNKFVKFLTIVAGAFLISLLAFWVMMLVFPNMEISLGLYLLISGISVILASLYLMSDMQYVREIVESGSPKVFEWSAAFGLMYDIVWIYIELLRIIFILAMLAGRRN